VGKIVNELRHHAPFTAFGALTGIIFMLVFRNMERETAHRVFYVFHPLHVFLSAVVTTAMYKRYQCDMNGKRCGLFSLALVGYVGAIGIATLSDSIIPFVGEILLRLPHAHVHAGFIEEWHIVNPAAILGIVVAYFWTSTKFPHAGHVLISTWASLFHMMMAFGADVSAGQYAAAVVFLFISVWIPCCVSDIVFPLFFVKEKAK